MEQFTIRLKQGDLFKEKIEALVREYDIKSGVILSAVGGLENANIRLSKLDTGEHIIRELKGPFELVSCMGTLSQEGCHIHVSFSDREGNCFGGHLKDGCEVFVTVELVFLVFKDVIYRRTLDSSTGFKELSSEKV
jgi:predicted DNA-binding protein with PD1-like motif